MSLTGKNLLSLRKRDVAEQKSVALGFKKVYFAHKATLGDTGINLASLTLPSAEMPTHVNPSPTDLLQLDLKFYQNNLTLVSSSKGLLIKDLSYTISSGSQINFKDWTADDGEIFTGVVDHNAKTSLMAVDANHINATGELAVGETDFNVGTPFEVGKFSTAQIGAVQVFRNGLIQFRNTGNSSTVLDGNYYEVPASGGLGTLIRFNVAAYGTPDNILVIANGLIIERPDASMKSEIEKVQGQVDALVPTVATLAGVPENTFQTAPNNVDLKVFGDMVLKLLSAEVPIMSDWQSYTPTWTNLTVGNAIQTFKWRQVGDSMEISGHFEWGSTTSGSGTFEFSLPNDYSVDNTKARSTYARFGTAWLQDTGVGVREIYRVVQNATNSRFYVAGQTNAGTSGNVGTTFPFTWATGDELDVLLTVPISGWTSTQTLREQLGL